MSGPGSDETRPRPVARATRWVIVVLLVVAAALVVVGLDESRDRDDATVPSPIVDGDPGRVILVVLDGVRWEDFFDVQSRRLRESNEPAPFEGFWRELAPLGIVYGDRTAGSRVRMTLRHPFARRLSTPSYQAMLSGWAQPCSNNDCGTVPVETLLESLRRRLDLPREKVAVVTTCSCVIWSAAHDRSAVYMDDGTLVVGGEGTARNPGDEWSQRSDAVTMEIALEVLRRQQPRFLLIQLDDADVRGHARDRAGYLEALTAMDAFLLRLFETLDEMGPGERARTTVLLTTDHGRGSNFASLWGSHGEIWGAQDVFLAAIGPHVPPVGRVKGEHAEIRHADLRPTIELLMGLEPSPCDHPTCGWPIASIVEGSAADPGSD